MAVAVCDGEQTDVMVNRRDHVAEVRNRPGGEPLNPTNLVAATHIPSIIVTVL
jgi:hypothetical protein